MKTFLGGIAVRMLATMYVCFSGLVLIAFSSFALATFRPGWGPLIFGGAMAVFILHAALVCYLHDSAATQVLPPKSDKKLVAQLLAKIKKLERRLGSVNAHNHKLKKKIDSRTTYAILTKGQVEDQTLECLECCQKVKVYVCRGCDLDFKIEDHVSEYERCHKCQRKLMPVS